MIEEAKEAQNEINSSRKEKVKKREELLKERKIKRRENKANKTIPKKEKENEYDPTYGQQNAIHLIVGMPEPQLVKVLIKLGINIDLSDQYQRTPFNLLSTHPCSANPTLASYRETLVNTLINKVNHDQPDHKGRTAFLNYFGNNFVSEFTRLMKLKININQIDASGLFALKYALIRRDEAQISNLVKNKADINLVDKKMRNCLHHAVNMSSSSADATFETEQLLIELGININQRDCYDRTPLHYAFVKIKDWANTTQIDPIETVSSMCGVAGLEVDVADKW